MNPLRRVVATLVAMVVATLAGLALAPAAGAAPGQPLQIGVHAPPAPDDGMGAVSVFEAAIGHKTDVISVYQSWGNAWGRSVRTDWMARATSGGRKILITWEPWVQGGGGVQNRYNLASIARGDHDGYMRGFARDLRIWGKPVYLRPMHEMNGNWYPWGVYTPGTGNNHALYKQAWQRMYRIFQQEGARNVRFVWSPVAHDWTNLNRYYPGTAFVDIMALDGYNFGTGDPATGRRTFQQVFLKSYQRLEKLGPQPIWFAEVGSAWDGGYKATFAQQMLRAIKAGYYPRLRTVIWFNGVGEFTKLDFRLDADAAAAAAFRAELDAYFR